MKTKDIRSAVEAVAGLDLSSESRDTEHVIGRCVYYKICIEHTCMGLKQIGSEVGRNHATVINARDKTIPGLEVRSHHFNLLLRKSLVQLGIISAEPCEATKLREENQELRRLLARDDDFISQIRHLNEEQYLTFKERAEVMLMFVKKINV